MAANLVSNSTLQTLADSHQLRREVSGCKIDLSCFRVVSVSADGKHCFWEPAWTGQWTGSTGHTCLCIGPVYHNPF